LGQVIALANQKGGVAKTTTTLNLGVALAERGKRVLAVDLDPQSNLTMSQGIDPDDLERSMFDVLVHKTPIEDIIVQREVDLAVASIDLAGAELAMSSMIGRERALQKALLPLRSTYEYVLVDTPPSLGLLTINALTAADSVIVPVQCEYLSLRGLIQLENTLSMIRENLNPDVRIRGILPTMFDGRTLHSREAVEILQENFGTLVFETRIRKTIRYAEAPVKGTSVLKYDSNGTAARAYRELAQEVLRGGADVLEVRVRSPIRLLGVFEEHLAVADDRVQGRAELVTHAREESGFRLVGLDGLVMRRGELCRALLDEFLEMLIEGLQPKVRLIDLARFRLSDQLGGFARLLLALKAALKTLDLVHVANFRVNRNRAIVPVPPERSSTLISIGSP